MKIKSWTVALTLSTCLLASSLAQARQPSSQTAAPRRGLAARLMSTLALAGMVAASPLARAYDNALVARAYAQGGPDAARAEMNRQDGMSPAQIAQRYAADRQATAAYSAGGPDLARYTMNLQGGMSPAAASAQYSADRQATAAYAVGGPDYARYMQNLQRGMSPAAAAAQYAADLQVSRAYAAGGPDAARALLQAQQR